MAAHHRSLTRRGLLTQALGVMASLAAVGLVTACGGSAATVSSSSAASAASQAPSAAPSSSAVSSSSAATTTASASSSVATSAATSAAPAPTVAPTAAPAATTAPTAAPVAAAPSGGKGVVQPLLRGDPEEVDAWKKIFTDFQAKNPSIKVDANYTTDNYDDKTLTLTAAGTPPGLWFPAADTGVKHWAAQNVIENLDPYIQRDKFDLSVFYDQYLPYMKFNGHMVALPTDEWPWNVYYNKTLFQKAGLDAPTTDWNDKTWTWEKFLEVGKALTQASGGKTTQWGIGDASMSGARFSAMLYGGDWFPEDSYVTGWIREFTGNAPEVIQAYQYLSDLANKYHVSPTAAEQKANGGSITKMFEAGQIGMTLNSAGFLETLRRQTTGVDFGLAAIPMPAAKPRRTLIWADYWCYFSGVKDPDAAWQLLKYMVTPEAQVLYPLQSGSVPSIKSLAGEWVKQRQAANKLGAEVLQIAIDAIPVSHVSADNFTVNWPDLGKVIETPMGNVLSGKQDAQTAIQSLTAAAQDIIKKTSAAATG